MSGERTIELVTGRMGTGKTTLAFHRALEIYPAKCVFVFDTACNFGQHEGSGFAIVHDYPAMRQAIDAPPRRAIIFQPDNLEQGLTEFARVVGQCTRHAVLVDESSFVQTAQRIHPELEKLVRSATGRSSRYGELSIILTQHRVSEINPLLQELVGRYYFFQTKRIRSLERIREIAGEEAAVRVAELGEREYLCWDVDRADWMINRDTRSWREQICRTKKEAVNGE